MKPFVSPASGGSASEKNPLQATADDAAQRPAVRANAVPLKFTPEAVSASAGGKSPSGFTAITQPQAATAASAAGNNEPETTARISDQDNGGRAHPEQMPDAQANSRTQEESPPPQPVAEPAPLADASEDAPAADTSEPSQLAQIPSPPPPGVVDPVRRPQPPVVGPVELRKPFKLFAREELIRSLSFRDTPVREVLSELARRGNLNILLDKTAVGKITGELRDVTLNEAMDSVLAATALEARALPNGTVVVGTHHAMLQMGLNRTQAKVFKLSYAHPYDVAQFLYTMVFNSGRAIELNALLRRRGSNTQRGESQDSNTENLSGELRSVGEGGAQKRHRTEDQKQGRQREEDENIIDDDTRQISRLDVIRTFRGTTRSQTQEGVGFNNAATDPGSQQIRQFQETPAEYTIDQNAGGPIVAPDVKLNAVLVVGTPDDLKVAEEAIRMLDRRPRLIHIQVSLVELSNDAIRRLGASLQTQGKGNSAFVLGQAAAPVINALPGQPAQTIGPVFPNTAQTIAGVTSLPQAQSVFNYLALQNRGGAGGTANVATFPEAVNITIDSLLQTNKAKLVANPSVVVVDNTETLISLAEEVLHKITTTSNLGVTTTNVELTKAGVFLNVLAKTTEDGFIRMRVRPNVSFPLIPPTTFGIPPNTTTVTLLSIREILTQEIRIKDGQTLVLGGLFTETEAANLAKIPYVAEMPILGAFARNSLKGRNRAELMILITPKIVDEEPPVATTSAPGAPAM